VGVDPSYEGRVYPPVGPYLVTREKIAEFADAIGDPNPAYRSVEAARALGHSDVVAPPTFPVVVGAAAQQAVWADPGLGLDWARVVHGEQTFEHGRPLVAGDLLEAVATVERIRTMAGNDLVTVRVDLRTPGGEQVCAARSMVVARAADA
jgi:acyl dehydratase